MTAPALIARPPRRQILKLMTKLQGKRSTRALARELGLNESMLRQLHTGATDIGADTYGALIVWDPKFEPLVLADLQARGRQVLGTRAAQPTVTVPA
jgi:hypothetical protein